MKRDIEVFADGTYSSGPDGVAQLHLHDLTLCPVLGQARILRLMFVGNARSKSTARAKLTVYETSNPKGRPREGQLPVGPQLVVTALGAQCFDVYGPTAGRLEVCLEVDDNDSPPATVQFSLAVYATVIL